MNKYSNITGRVYMVISTKEKKMPLSKSKLQLQKILENKKVIVIHVGYTSIVDRALLYNKYRRQGSTIIIQIFI